MRLARPVLVTLAVGLLVAAPAQARTVSVTSHFDDPGFLVITPESCDPAQAGFCTAGGDGGATFSGDLVGWSAYHATFWMDPVPYGAKGHVSETFHGKIAGCGRGTVHWDLFATIPFSEYDATTNTFPMSGTWQISRDSGSGQLTGAAGGGTFTATANLLTRENHGTLSGNVTCGSRRSR